jgi:hypothetical protein
MRARLFVARSEDEAKGARDHADCQLGDGSPVDRVDPQRQSAALDVDLDLATRRSRDARVREVGPLREPGAHGPALAPPQGVDLDLDAAVTGMAPGHDVETVEELAVGDDDRGGRPARSARRSPAGPAGSRARSR